MRCIRQGFENKVDLFAHLQGCGAVAVEQTQDHENGEGRQSCEGDGVRQLVCHGERYGDDERYRREFHVVEEEKREEENENASQ